MEHAFLIIHLKSTVGLGVSYVISLKLVVDSSALSTTHFKLSYIFVQKNIGRHLPSMPFSKCIRGSREAAWISLQDDCSSWPMSVFISTIHCHRNRNKERSYGDIHCASGQVNSAGRCVSIYPEKEGITLHTPGAFLPNMRSDRLTITCTIEGHVQSNQQVPWRGSTALIVWTSSTQIISSD